MLISHSSLNQGRIKYNRITCIYPPNQVNEAILKIYVIEYQSEFSNRKYQSQRKHLNDTSFGDSRGI